MSSPLIQDLREHLLLCEQLLALTQRESQALREPEQSSQFEFCQQRKSLLARLNSSVDSLRLQRMAWQKLSPAQRASQPEAPGLMRQNQDLIMRILMLDRENEQALLRRGLVPARHVPAAPRQQPHFVADLYRRSRLSSADAD